MDIKTFLYRIRKEFAEIKNTQDEIEQMRASLLPAGIRYDSDRVQSSPTDRMSNRIAAVQDMENNLTAQIEQLRDDQLAARYVISRLDDPCERQVIECYFLSIRRPTMEQVASMMNYSMDSCWKFYNRAFDSFTHMDADTILHHYRELQNKL